ncbi:alkylglycerol monooxygenase-like [Hetaerina americana]|uniref:alkylglycerol monooxygenase-like n=1 Tax=Hetaerina americana TaxID=62018 RepID=UPI003A7F19BC
MGLGMMESETLSEVSSSASSWWPSTEPVRRFLYAFTLPSEASYQLPEQVPEIFRESWPYFITLIILENIVLRLQGKPKHRLNDTITSLSHGLILETGRLIFRGAESSLYMVIYDRWRVANLPWDSPWTWYLALLVVDFCYYWLHRASHEVHFLWAQHQVHHSSEEYNLAVGLRQSILHGWCGSLFYLPMALFVPPSHYLTHLHFSLLYQFWMHTRAINTLGPLEWVFNTPKHHRVHHGCNLYCLDKNYGGFLIIWDRIFGTFASEKEGEQIIYGLVLNNPSFNPLWLQVFYNQHVVDKWKSMEGWQNKLAAIWKGPSWFPGQPRLGSEEFKIDVKERIKYDVHLPAWCNLYLLLHFCIVVIGFQELAVRHMSMSPLAVLWFSAYILISLTSIGMLFDNRPNACAFEFLRCLLFVSYVQHYGSPIVGSLMASLQVLFVLSGTFWALQTLKILQIKIKTE